MSSSIQTSGGITVINKNGNIDINGKVKKVTINGFDACTNKPTLQTSISLIITSALLGAMGALMVFAVAFL